MLAHQVCMVFIWKVFKSQNKISIYSPNPDFLSPHADCLEEDFLTQECKFVNFKKGHKLFYVEDLQVKGLDTNCILRRPC